MKKLKIGQRVWIYNSPLRPEFATIIGKLEGFEAYEVKHKDGREKIKVYISDYIFAYPDDRYFLIDKLYQHSQSLNDYAEELEEFAEENNPNNPTLWID